MNDKNLYDELFNFQQNPEHFENRKVGLSRSSTNFIVAGVCAGIAKFLKKDPKIIRLITLFLLLLGWFPFLVYLILGFLLPLEKTNFNINEDEIIEINNENSKIILGSIIFLVGFHLAVSNLGFESSLNFFFLQNEFITYSFALIISGIILSDKITFPIYFNDKNSLFETSKNQKVIFGVCAGLANYLSVNVLIIRVIFSVLFFLTLGLFSVFYLLIYFFFKISADKIND